MVRETPRSRFLEVLDGIATTTITGLRARALIAVILAWGTADPAADITGDAMVNVDDLVQVILDWGVCR